MKTAGITGASGAIGGATVKKFVSDGYFTVGQYNNGAEEIAALKESLGADGRDIFFPFRADLSRSDGAESLAAFVLENFGHADALICNAGADLYKLCAETEEKEWDYIFDVNVKSAFLLVKRFIPSMTERKKGSVLFTSSIWGVSGACMETAYSASKAALIGFGKALSKELAPSGITVNCLCPGVIDTKMNARFDSEEKADLIARTPLGRFGTPEEIADIAHYLCCRTPFITGQAIVADGGFTV